jgi:hypothetical protein
MLLLAVQIFNREAVRPQRFALLHPAANGGERNGEQLRVEPRLGLAEAGKEDLDLLTLRVDAVVALVLVVLERWVIPDPIGELAQLL